MRFGTAIERLVDNYQYAKSKIWIRDEVAWALYHTWKEADDRKTEPSNSEIPNNCEHITKDGVTCAKYPACDDCLDNPLNKAKGSERLVKGSEQTEPTISKMEQVEDEPQTEPLPKTINGVRIADAVAWADKWLEDNSVSEMWDMIRTLRDATEWQDEPQTKDLQDWEDRMWAEAIVTEPTCDTCRHKGVEGCEQPCLGCGCCGLYEAMTGNDKLKEKVVEFLKTCARCKHRPIGAMMCEESCHYEPQPTTQAETQNSNLTFEKRTMLDCYNCKYFCTENCIECHYEPKDEPQTSTPKSMRNLV